MRLLPSSRRRALPLTVGVLSALALVPLVWASSATGVAVPVAAAFADGAELTASAAELGGLVYEGTVTVATAAGDAEVIKLTSASAALTGLGLHVPCRPAGPAGGITVDAVTPAGSTSAAGEGITVYATSVTGNADGAAVTWTPASPPPAAELGDVALTDLVVDFAGIEAPSLVTPGLAQTASFC